MAIPIWLTIAVSVKIWPLFDLTVRLEAIPPLRRLIADVCTSEQITEPDSTSILSCGESESRLANQSSRFTPTTSASYLH